MMSLSRYPTLLFLASVATLVLTEMMTMTWALEKQDKAPLKIFLLAGQSNMVGMAKLEHLQVLIHDNSTCCNEYRKALWNGTGYKTRTDVFYKHDDFHGNLTVDSFRTFGPEVGFGWTIGDAMDEPVLLIKTAWGGRNLAIDFRPPSSGAGNFSKVKPHQYGWEYRQMIQDIEEALATLAEWVPSYDKDVGYVLTGFLWFQGWNDMLIWPFVDEYQRNLINLMRDVRLDLNAPGLPMLVGELGMHGLDPSGPGKDRVNAMRAIEENTTWLEEFQNNSIFVRTAPYVISNDTKSWGNGYHYGARADTMFHIGIAFGRGMLELLSGKATTSQSEDIDKHAVISSWSTSIARWLLQSL